MLAKRGLSNSPSAQTTHSEYDGPIIQAPLRDVCGLAVSPPPALRSRARKWEDLGFESEAQGGGYPLRSSATPGRSGMEYNAS